MDNSKKFIGNFETSRSKHLLIAEHCSFGKSLLRMRLSNTDGCIFCGQKDKAPIHLAIANQNKQCFGQKACRGFVKMK